MRRPWSFAAPILALTGALLIAACAQAPATTDFGTPDPVDSSGASTVVPSGPTLGTIPVWLSEHGILLWSPEVTSTGTYAFEIENVGEQNHDFIIVYARSIEAIPVRSDRALLHDQQVVARSPILQPEQSTTMLANLNQPGTYVVLSSQGRDFGLGMASVVTVGGVAGGRAEPIATPPPDDSETINAYLVDDAIFLHQRTVNAGIVTFNVQNIGPSEHDFVVLQWRGDPTALPVDENGDVLLDALVVMDRLPPIPPGDTQMLEVELEEEFAYVVLSSLPGDYDAGMSAQVVPR